MEIFFCDGCGKRITDLDFQAGKAVDFEGQRFCAACGAKVGPTSLTGPAGGRPPTARATPLRTTPSRLTPRRTTPTRLTPARTTPARGTRARPASGSAARARTPSGIRPAAGASGSGLQDVVGAPRSITAMRRQRRETAAKPKPLMWLGIVLLVIVMIAALALIARTGSEPSGTPTGDPTPLPGHSAGNGETPGVSPSTGGAQGAATALAKARTREELTPWLVQEVHEAYQAVARDHANTEAARTAVRLAAEWKTRVTGPGFDTILDEADQYAGAHFADETGDALRGRVSFWAACWSQAAKLAVMAAAEKVKSRHDTALAALVALEVDAPLRIPPPIKAGWQPVGGGRAPYFKRGERGGLSLRCEPAGGATFGARRVMSLIDRNSLIRFQFKAVGLRSLEVRATSTTQGGTILSVIVEDVKPGAWARAIVPLRNLRRPGSEKPSGRNNAFSEISIVGMKDPVATESYLLLDEIFIEEGRK